MKRVKAILLICALLITAIQLSAHDNHSTKVSSSDISPFLQDIVDEVNGIHEKLSGLADEMSEEQYSWRPAEGVRSVSESFIHAVSANYFLLSYFGKPMPEGFSRDLEKKVTSKEEVKKWLDDSYKSAAEFISTIDESTLQEKVDLPFGKFTKQKCLFIVVTHGHEHLGQMIAYARMNGVVPPWSKKQEGEG